MIFHSYVSLPEGTTKKNMKNTHSLKWWFNETVMKTRAENEFVNPDYQLGGLPQNSDKRLFEMVPPC